MKRILIIFGLILAILAGAYYYLYFFTEIFVASVDSFEKCQRAGRPVQESYPRRCVGSDGRTFTEDIGNALEKADLIRVITPRPGDIVTSPFVAEGEARGYWYFEASFPIRAKDSSGNELGVAIAQAQGEWMTTEFVPFKTEFSFKTPITATGTIVFEKDNPSGLPEHADELLVPVRFY